MDMAYSPVEGTGWSIGITVDYKDILERVNAMKNIGMILTLVSILVELCVTVLFTNKLSKAIKKITQKVDMISKGDFTVEIEKELLNRQDEIGIISRSLEQLKYSISSITTIIDEFSDKIDVVSGYVNNVNTNSIEISKKTKESKTTVLEMEHSVNNFGEEFSEFNHNISELGKNMNTVSSITNLAEKSKSSSEEIYKIITQSCKNTNEIVLKTNYINAELENQKDNIKDVLNVFDSIAEAVESTIPELNNTYEEFKEIKDRKNNIVRNIEEISAISEEVSASSEEISASSSELKQSSEEVAVSAQELSRKTREIMEEFNKFKLE